MRCLSSCVTPRYGILSVNFGIIPNLALINKRAVFDSSLPNLIDFANLVSDTRQQNLVLSLNVDNAING
jgi:hypothetical protein